MLHTAELAQRLSDGANIRSCGQGSGNGSQRILHVELPGNAHLRRGKHLHRRSLRPGLIHDTALR
ncbi:hypothetical protein D3C81_2013230 [compost metagenome]